MTLTELTAEIQTELSNYAQDIDKITVKTNVIQQLRVFGTNIAELKEKVLLVKNSKCTLPSEFKSLRLALKLEPIGCNIQGDKKDLQNSYIWRERIENPMWFDEVNQEYVKTCHPKIITEVIYTGNTSTTFYYNQQWLSLVKGVQKDNIDSSCLNLHPSIRNAYPFEISINQTTINTNFSEGSIYVQYNALPTTEDGDIIIPEYTTGDIRTYIKQYVKVQIAEDLIANNKNPMGIAQLYASWKQELPMLKSAALKEAKFAGLEKNWGKRFKELNRRDIAVFELPNLNF